jgi:hypothetical protein
MMLLWTFARSIPKSEVCDDVSAEGLDICWVILVHCWMIAELI